MLTVFFILSFVVFWTSCFSFFYKRKKLHSFLNGTQTFILGLFFAACLFYVPYYLEMFANEQIAEQIGKTFLMSVHHAISIFVVALNFQDVYNYALGNGVVGAIYACYGAFLFVMAPLATFGFIFTYANNFNAYLKILLFWRRKVYVFSELNHYTIALAKDIRSNEQKSILIFTNVSSDEKTSVIEETKNIHARCIKSDILSFHIKTLKLRNNIIYVLLNKNESENISDIYSIMNSEEPKAFRHIYACLDSNNALSEINNSSSLCIHRFDNIYSLVLEMVNKIGVDIFKKPSGCEKTINVLLVGMGRIGKQLVKTLSWYTQVEGYKTNIYAFDKSDVIKDQFEHECPGFFDINTVSDCGINIFGGYLVGTHSFDEEIKKLKNIDCAFICLGDDELNINTAYDIRMLLAENNSNYKIQTIVSDIYKGRILKSKPIDDVEFVLDAETIYSYNVFFAPDKIKKMVEAHLKWGCNYENSAKEILNDEYIFKSTEAFVISDYVYTSLELSDGDKKVSEHKRWLNYMYANGYKYGENKDKMRKTHPMLVKWEELPNEMKDNI